MTRPKQALRELVLPSPRPWHALTIWWESFRGFHLAVPMPEAATEVRLERLHSIGIWKEWTDTYGPGLRFLRQSTEIPVELQVTLEGTRTGLARVEVIEAVAPFVPGLNEPFRCSRRSLEAQPFPEAPVPETLPLPMSARTAAPIIGLSEGLLIWNRVINSYTRRPWCSPKLREGGRSVHMLQLAPSAPIEEPCEMSAA